MCARACVCVREREREREREIEREIYTRCVKFIYNNFGCLSFLLSFFFTLFILHYLCLYLFLSFSQYANARLFMITLQYLIFHVCVGVNNFVLTIVHFSNRDIDIEIDFSLFLYIYMHLSIYLSIIHTQTHTHTRTYTHTHTHIYIYIYIYWEREREITKYNIVYRSLVKEHKTFLFIWSNVFLFLSSFFV